MHTRHRHSLAAAFVAAMTLPAMSPSHASAATACIGENFLPTLIWMSRTLDAGTTYTIETANITGDTVIHLLQSNPSGDADHKWIQVAANDDFIGFASRVVFTPTTTGTYRVLVRSYSTTTTGVADVRINGTTVLTQNPFGSNVLTWARDPGERVRVTSTRRSWGGVDPMLFLMGAGSTIVEMNDDSGPNLYPTVLTDSQDLVGRYAWGHYPGNFGFGRLTVEPPRTIFSELFDLDGDGLDTDLEVACGLNALSADTDLDTIPDRLELFGNNGFSFSLGNVYGGNHVFPNLYVEVDAMNSPNVPVPYANLAQDMAAIFTSDAGFVDTYVEVEPTPSLPYSQGVALSNCGTVVNCQTVTALRAANFSVGSPERQPYFHYTVVGDQQVSSTGTNPPALTCSSGIAPFLGTNLIVSVGTSCAWAGNQAQQRGTSMHELGHNLNLTHNGNDDPSNNFSAVHASVMNYNYQMPGVPGRTAPLQHTYSFGVGGCQSCLTSPKQACITARSGLFGVLCPLFAPTCDCDVREWHGGVTFDFANGVPLPGSPAGIEADDEQEALAQAQAALDARDGLLPEPGRADNVRVARTIVANQLDDEAPEQKQLAPTPWQGEPASGLGADNGKGNGKSQRPELVDALVERLQEQGLVPGLDFQVTEDGVLQSCL
jgi:hypothetical protein